MKIRGKKVKLKIGDEVRVVWIDAGHNSGWAKPNEAGSDNKRRLMCITSGFLLENKKYSIKVFASYSDLNGILLGEVAGVTEIPTCSIKKIMKKTKEIIVYKRKI